MRCRTGRTQSARLRIPTFRVIAVRAKELGVGTRALFTLAPHDGAADLQADETGQMRMLGAAGDWELEIHELGDDGQPRCGPKPDSYRGKTMRLVKLGRASVTCKPCAQITGH